MTQPIAWLDGPFWPYLALLLFAVLPTEIWRWLAVAFSRRTQFDDLIRGDRIPVRLGRERGQNPNSQWNFASHDVASGSSWCFVGRCLPGGIAIP